MLDHRGRNVRRATAKANNDDSSDTSRKENKAVAYCLPRARGLLGHGSRQLARDSFSTICSVA